MTRLADYFHSFKSRRSRILQNADNLSFNSFVNDPCQHDTFPTTRESSLTNDDTDKIQANGYVKFSPNDVKLSDCSRPSIVSILLLLLLLFVVLVLPTIFILDCFGYFELSQTSMFHNVRENVKRHQELPVHHYTYDLADDKPKLPPPPPADYKQCQVIPNEYRLDCYPERDVTITRQLCEARGCCWLPKNTKNRGKLKSNGMNVPFCFYPNNFETYRYVNVTETAFGLEAFLKRNYASPYPGDVETIQMIVKFETTTRLRIKFLDYQVDRYEPPYPEIPIVDRAAINLTYNFYLNKIHSGFTVTRKSDNATIFDSMNFKNMIFSEQFLQISTILPSEKIYGLGEHRNRFALPINWQTTTMFNHDGIPEENKNLYGSHPFYLSLEKSNNANGVFLLNSNAMEVITQPAPALTYRALGGIFEFFIFLGPTPADVVRQYNDLIGFPYMPPYWSLGFHLCRFGYKSLNNTRAVMQRNLDAGIAIDTQWNDLDYMNNSNDFTYDHVNFKGLPAFIKELHKREMHYIPMVDPGISASELKGTYIPFDKGIEMDIFVKNSSGQPFIGKVWNSGSTVWPDFTNPSSVNYWTVMLRSLHDQMPFDGAWIDMNEPSNFLSGTIDAECPGTKLDKPPYLPPVDGGKLYYKTLCMTAKLFAGMHYDVHNIYGLAEAIVTSFALAEIRGKRPLVISRATFPSHGHYAGHWSGDVTSKWIDMEYSIPQLLSFSLFGIPLTGADICGFNGNTTAELCNRWHQLGAFYPFSRNHNTDDGIDQDPAAFGIEVVKATKKAFAVRYALLPYLYTLFHNAHIKGDTVARPLFFEFVNDTKTHSIDDQFLWGPAIFILPVLQHNVTVITPYIPAALWYDYYTHAPILGNGSRIKMAAPLDTIPVLVRGGYVIPMQLAGKTTAECRRSKVELLAASDEKGNGYGSLYWDDGDSLNTYQERKYSLIEFTLTNGQLISNPSFWGPENPPNLGLVTILGVQTSVTHVSVNKMETSFEYNTVNKSLVIVLDLSFQNKIVITWK